MHKQKFWVFGIVSLFAIESCTVDSNLGWHDDGEYTETQSEFDFGCTPQWQSHIVDTNIHCLSIATADINSDGHMDIVGATTDERGDLVWFENEQGTGDTWVRRFITNQFCQSWSLLIADMDMDGDPDIFSSNFATGNCDSKGGIVWFENRVGEQNTWVKHIIEEMKPIIIPALVDVDGDKDMDVVGAFTSNSGTLALWENTSGNAKNWEKRIIGSELGYVSPLISDSNGDGDPDIFLLPNIAADAQINVFENQDGNGKNWAIQPTVPTELVSLSLFFSDVDNDGDMDVFSSDNAQNVHWLENQGDSAPWMPHTVYQGEEIRFSIQGGVDIDFDGDIDALGQVEDNNNAIYFENPNANGSQWAYHIIATNVDSTIPLIAADINGDPKPDIVGCDAAHNHVFWMESLFTK